MLNIVKSFFSSDEGKKHSPSELKDHPYSKLLHEIEKDGTIKEQNSGGYPTNYGLSISKKVSIVLFF